MENPFELILAKLHSIEMLLIKQLPINLPDAVPIQQKDILTINEATDYLSLSKSAIYKMTSGLSIPFYKVGKKIYFNRLELLEWIENHRIKTKEDIEKEAIEYMSRSRKHLQKTYREVNLIIGF